MSKPLLGKIQGVDPREVWKNEEKDFTPWIAENIEELSKTIGIPFTIEQTEKKVGNYELDVYGHVEGSDSIVVIENQLETTDHKHLGQLITYAAGLEAAIIIWIAVEVTEEHKDAIDWLNENTNDSISFYLVRPEIFKIDDSNPAVQFRIEAAPNEPKRELQEAIDESGAPRQQFRRKFWADLLDYFVKHGHSWAENRSTTKDSWIYSPIGKTNVSVNVSMAMGSRIRVEIYCYNDRDKNVFKKLEVQKENIKKFFPDENISWEPLEDAKASRVAVYKPYEKDDVAEDTNERRILFEWIEKNLSRFREAARLYL